MTINISIPAVTEKVRAAAGQMIGIMGEEILADCNEYAKEASGAMKASSMIHSTTDPLNLELKWSTSYARRQYWEIPTASHDKNPKACWQWCHAAKAEYLHKWEKQASILLRGML